MTSKVSSATTPAGAASTPTQTPAATAVATKSKIDIRPLEETHYIVHNCQDLPEKGQVAADVFNERVLEIDAKFALEKDLISYEGRYDEVPYDPKDPEKGKVEQIGNTAFLTNVVPAPDSLTVNTQPKRMGKMELKAFKKSPFLKNPKHVMPLLVAAERRSMRRVLLGHHYLIGGLVTYPGYDATYDEVDNEFLMLRAVLENTKINELEIKSAATSETITVKNFANFAVVYIERADGSVEARFAEPTLVTITVGNYLATLNARVESVENETKDPGKLKQYRGMITRYIEWTDAWLKSDPKKNTVDTVLTMYNYNVVSDTIIVETEVFHFLRGTVKKPVEPEKIAANWLYIHNHGNRTHLHAEFRGKVRLLSDYNVDEPDDVILKDDTNKMFSVSLRYAIPIVPEAAYMYWKKSTEGQKVIEESGNKKKRVPKRSSSSASITKPKKSTGEDDGGDESDEDDGDDAEDDKKSKLKRTSKRKSKTTNDDDGESGDDDEDNTDASDGGEKKSKKAAVSAAKGKPSKTEIGEHGTAEETAKKIKADLAAKKAQAVEADASGTDDDNGVDEEQTKKKAKKSNGNFDAKSVMDDVAQHTTSLKTDMN